MKKITTWTAFIAAVSFTIISCKKEINSNGDENNLTSSSQASGPVTRPYHDSFDNAIRFIPDIAGGWVAPNFAPSWLPGEGSGIVAHMGPATMYFNQYANGTTVVAAPVTMFFSSQLTDAGYTNVPSGVSTIVFDDKGNSIWFHHTSIIPTPVSATRVDVLVEEDIVGGTGRFADATGHVTLNTHYNPQDLTESGSVGNGWIRY